MSPEIIERFRYEDGYFHIGSTRLPVVHYNSTEGDGPVVWKTRQVILGFENRWHISIIWGYGTYSDNKNCFLGDGPEFTETPQTVECAVFNPNWEFAMDDQVLGWQRPSDVLNLIEMVKLQPSHPDVVDAESTEISGELGP